MLCGCTQATNGTSYTAASLAGLWKAPDSGSDSTLLIMKVQTSGAFELWIDSNTNNAIDEASDMRYCKGSFTIDGTTFSAIITHEGNGSNWKECNPHVYAGSGTINSATSMSATIGTDTFTFTKL